MIHVPWLKTGRTFHTLMIVSDFLRPHIMSKVALTQGQWSVIDKEIWFDETNGFVYFHGLRETPLEKHLYVVSIDQPCNVRRLTTSGYSHTAHLNQVRSRTVENNIQ